MAYGSNNFGSASYKISRPISPMLRDRVKILTREEEVRVWERWKETGDPKYRNQLLMGVMLIVSGVVRHYVGSSAFTRYRFRVDVEAMESQAYMEVITRMGNFDPAKGRLASIIGFHARNACSDYMREMSGALKAPEPKPGQTLSQTLSMTDVSSASISDGTKDREYGQKQQRAKIDLSEDPWAELEDAQNSEFVRAALKRAIGELQSRDRLIVDALMQDRETPVTLEEIGQRLGVTRERIRQVRNRIFRSLAKSMLAERGVRRALSDMGIAA